MLAGQGKKRVCDNCFKRSDDTVDTPTTQQGGEGEMQMSDSESSGPPALYELEALYDYDPQEQASKKLKFKQGDRIAILYADPSGWWLGEHQSGTRGWVPSPYLDTPEAG